VADRVTVLKAVKSEHARCLCGDVFARLPEIPDESVHCVATSPPYWGLRDYGTGDWEGGDPDCDHRSPTMREGRNEDRPKLAGSVATNSAQLLLAARSKCGKCGAKRIDRQLGSEEVPDCLGWATGVRCGECHVCRMTAVFREVRRVLRDDGTLWLNYGDTYSGGKSGRADNDPETRARMDAHGHGGGVKLQAKGNTGKQRKPTDGLPAGNLVGIPWRVAFSLQADGWILRQDIIWSKMAPMPESVRNRCTKSHEYVFLFAKRRDYFCDMEAIKEPAIHAGEFFRFNSKKKAGRLVNGATASGNEHPDAVPVEVANNRNRRSVWRVATHGYPGAHFATFPRALVEPMILAGTSSRGCCPDCKAPWRRVVESVPLTRERPNKYTKRTGEAGTGNHCANDVAGVETKTVGWEPTCACEAVRTLPAAPCVVFDPFAGSGTTLEVAVLAGRNALGVELNPEYMQLIKKRITAAEKGRGFVAL
jgi:DNA modification methylase